MAATRQDYDDLARDYEYLAALLVQANARADTLGLTVPCTVADVLTMPASIARARGLDPDPEVPITRHDEAPDD